MAIKIPFELAQGLIGKDGIVSFVPFGRKVMREWIQINRLNPEEYLGDLEIFNQSIEFVRSLN